MMKGMTRTMMIRRVCIVYVCDYYDFYDDGDDFYDDDDDAMVYAVVRCCV